MTGMTRSIVAIAATVAVLAIGFFAYDLLRPVTSPCESIFQQTATSLGSKLELLKAKGEIFIGKEKIQDLTERAQVTALNLKTCCIVLNAGAVNSEQFLQCQGSAQRYEREIETAAKTAGEAQAAQQQGQSDEVAAKVQAINESLIAAQAQSQLLQQTLVQLTGPPTTLLNSGAASSGSSASASPAVTQQAQAASGGESEPNNDPQHASPLALGAWIDAAIGDANDDDVFKLRTPAGNRDLYRVEVENRSTGWGPALTVLNAQKTPVENTVNGNAGADVALVFAGEPDADYYVVVGRYFAASAEYRLRVAAQMAFDRYEPNDSIIKATPIAAEAPIKANIMDGADVDYFKVPAPATAAKIVVSFENRSTTLSPSIQVFDGRKSKIYNAYDSTPGANLDLSVDVKPSPDFYVLVDKNAATSGDYTLTVRFE